MPGLTGLELQEALAIAGQRVSHRLHHGLRRRPGQRQGHEGRGGRFSHQARRRRELLGAIERAVTKAGQARREQARTTEIQDRIKTLTPREAEVFALVVTGMLNKQIASDARHRREDGQGASGPRHGEDAGRIAGRAGPAGRPGGRDRREVLIASDSGTGSRRRLGMDQGPLPRQARIRQSVFEGYDFVVHTMPLISIVDDDLSVRRALRRLVQSAGYVVETFASACEFLASSPADRTACLVLDIHLGGMSGFELQRRLAADRVGHPDHFHHRS